MTVLILIFTGLLWICSGVLLWRRQMLAPVASWLALFIMHFAKNGADAMLPINFTIIINWLCITLVVMAVTAMQPAEIISQKRGMGYMAGGALTGMVVGLLASTVTSEINALYGLMIIGTVIGTFFGFLLFTSTPKGAGVNIRSGRFFKYLLAKGFPTAVTVMMVGVVLMLAMITYNQTT